MMCVLVSFNNTMIRSTFVFLIWLLQGSLGAKYEGCESPQYLKFGTPGVIECVFHQTFTSIFWYDSTNIIVDEPIVTLINSVRGGRGYYTGEYDISASGSLIITDVVVSHAKNFTVSKFASLDLDGDPTTITILAVVEGVVSDDCESPQYLEYGQRGTVKCLFQTNFISLLWYNSTDTVVDAPIVTYTPPVESGLGFQSGDFDIFPNGSLVVHKVGLIHELNYTVAKFTDLNEDPLTFVIQVVVTVKSLFEGPLIDICENDGAICFTELDVHSAVNCDVRRVRPIVSLKWMTVTSSGDLKIYSKMSSTMDNVTSTTTAATLGAFAQSPVLNLLVCKAEFAPGVLRRDKSLVLVQNRQMNLSSISPVIKYVRLGSTLELTCGGNTTPYFYVWKRSFPFDNQYDKLMFAVLTENRLETKYSDNFQFEENGSLVVGHVGPEHDGFYGCIYGNGITDGMTKYKVVTYENPVPEYPLVEGCNDKSHCVLTVNREGNLTCSMNGIRPEVKLQWREATEDTGKIAFFDHITRVTERGGISNISHTCSYSATTGQEITIICSVVHELDIELSLTNFTVVILYFDLDEYQDYSSISPRNDIITVILCLQSSLFLTLVLIWGLEVFNSGTFHSFRDASTGESRKSYARKADDSVVAKRGHTKMKIVIVVLTAYLLSVSITSCGMVISVSAKQIGRTSDEASSRRFRVVILICTVICVLLVLRMWGRQLFTAGFTRIRKRKKRGLCSKKCPDSCKVRVAPDSEESEPFEISATAKPTPDCDSLIFLSRHLGVEWMEVARRLLPGESHVLNMEVYGRDSVMYASLNMLTTWKLTNGSGATYDTLIEALGEAGRGDLAHSMQNRDALEQFQLSLHYLDLAVPVTIVQGSCQSTEYCGRRLSIIYNLETRTKDIWSTLTTKKSIATISNRFK